MNTKTDGVMGLNTISEIAMIQIMKIHIIPSRNILNARKRRKKTSNIC